MSKIKKKNSNPWNFGKKKKKNSKPWNFGKKKYFTYLYIFKRTSRIFQNALLKSLIYPIKHYKNFHNLLTNMDR